MTGAAFNSLPVCARCGADLAKVPFTMSRFNTDDICLECVDKEKAHPAYQAAYEAEVAEVRKGNYNFAGIGCPTKLYINRK